MIPNVRVAIPGDAPECQRLESSARNETAGARGADAFFAQHPTAFLVSDADGFSLVAELDGVVVGYATVAVALEAGARVAMLTRVYVTPLARRIGVGDALIAAAQNTSRSRGCGRLDALSLPGDRDTKNLFERNGLTARLIVASRAL